jgi:coenzyme F420-reducing hydrogenase beta subunit
LPGKLPFLPQVCPFSEQEENEDTLGKAIFGHIDGIKHRPETGYYLDSYVGYSNINDHRANGASGGMATWLLETLLLTPGLDHVICVTPHHDPEKLFRFAIFDSLEPIRHSAGSAYYPVEMSEVIRKVIENEGRYAIIGLPCFIKGLRLAARKNKKLQERIVAAIGLVCGQMKSRQ